MRQSALDARWHSAIFEERDISPDDVRATFNVYVRPCLEITIATSLDRDQLVLMTFRQAIRVTRLIASPRENTAPALFLIGSRPRSGHDFVSDLTHCLLLPYFSLIFLLHPTSYILHFDRTCSKLRSLLSFYTESNYYYYYYYY